MSPFSLQKINTPPFSMSVTIDYLVFEESERGPSQDLRLQFEALSQFDEEEKKIAKALLESLILKHNAKG